MPDDDGNPDLIEAMREGHRAAVAELATAHHDDPEHWSIAQL